jgi:hypothetical protein
VEPPHRGLETSEEPSRCGGVGVAVNLRHCWSRTGRRPLSSLSSPSHERGKRKVGDAGELGPQRGDIGTMISALPSVASFNTTWCRGR